MTKYRFVKTFRYQTSATTYEEYPAGSEAPLDAERLAEARSEGAIEEPEQAPAKVKA
ncbi:hypothetical protein ACFPIF_00075 [Brevundimonas faecalis]|uniref:hypothetical protein n=1 Tax=Brevundimonas faecalis TaxID=947378 RepID=UPI00362268AF